MTRRCRIASWLLPGLLLACSSPAPRMDSTMDSSTRDVVVDPADTLAADLLTPDAGPPPPSFHLVTVEGETIKSGIFDPSVEYDSAGVGWLTYSWVDWPMYVETHLARSTDQGAHWSFVEKLSTSAAETNKDGEVVWRYETSTLVYDASDEPSRRWKYLAQRIPTPTASCSDGTCEAPRASWRPSMTSCESQSRGSSTIDEPSYVQLSKFVRTRTLASRLPWSGNNPTTST